MERQKTDFNEMLYNHGVDVLKLRNLILEGQCSRRKKRTLEQDKYWAETQERDIYRLFEKHKKELTKLPWDYKELYSEFVFFKVST